MKAFGYCRVSTTDQQDEGVSLCNQQERINAWASANGHDLAGMYVEARSDGRADNRPELKKAMAAACREGDAWSHRPQYGCGEGINQAGWAVGTKHSARHHPASRENGGVKKKKTTTKRFPDVAKSEVESLPKTEAVLLRLTKLDKAAITAAASSLHLTVTEFLTKSALIVASKVSK